MGYRSVAPRARVSSSLDEHVVPVARGLEMLARPLSLRVVAADRDHGDPAAVTARHHAAAGGAAALCAGATARGSGRGGDRAVLDQAHAARRRFIGGRGGAADRDGPNATRSTSSTVRPSCACSRPTRRRSSIPRMTRSTISARRSVNSRCVLCRCPLWSAGVIRWRLVVALLIENRAPGSTTHRACPALR